MGIVSWKLNPVLGRGGSDMGNSEPLLTHTRFQLLRQGIWWEDSHQWTDDIQYCRCNVNKQSEERKAPFLFILHQSFVNAQSF